MHKTVAVIGHVDHGKTSLVKALTGKNTDALKEEQSRGLSIVLGFASYQTSAGRLHFIDAPGHADFIQTAASGLSGADAVLLVLSSVDGISAQTIEHLKLAYLLGIERAVVAMTKSDLVSQHEPKTTYNDVANLMMDCGFQGAPIVTCSSQTGDGLEALKDTLAELAREQVERPQLPGFFLPVDRVFSVQGAGTVVTGTLLGNAINIGDAAHVEPKRIDSSVRGLQVDGETVDRAQPGQRVAVNIRNIEAGDLKKGDVLCAPSNHAASQLFDITLEPEAPETRPLRHMEPVVVLHGTTHSAARVRLFDLGNPHIQKSARMAQLEFTSPQIGFAGQRFVIRRPATLETVTGGTILDPNATRVTHNKAAHIEVWDATLRGDLKDVARALATRDQGCVDLYLLARLARTSIDNCIEALGSDFVIGSPTMAFSSAAIAALEDQILQVLSDFHKTRSLRPQIDDAMLRSNLGPHDGALATKALEQLLENETVVQSLDGLARADHDPNTAMSKTAQAEYAAAQQRLKDMGLRPTSLFETSSLPAEQQDDLTELLIWNQHALRFYNHSLRQSLLLHPDSVSDAAQTVAAAFAPSESFTTGEARDLLNTNRKTIVPLLEHFDTVGLTRRVGDLRYIQPSKQSD